MPAIFSITTRHQRLRLIGSCDNYYVFAPGDLLDLHPWPAWCAACARFTEAEQFETVAWYDEQIKVAEHYHKSPGLLPPDGSVRPGDLYDLRRRRAWVSARRSPAKCIECGSTAVTVLWGDADAFDVPGVGRVELQVCGRCSSEGPCVHHWYFTPEGDRVPEPSGATRRRASARSRER
ncbi:MAG TPA: hypothetical protein VEA69_23190 [Tepidisphaeraceae bacterium]|nr:hypothetical protein [Tepidisphaeraceae bacterium]